MERLPRTGRPADDESAAVTPNEEGMKKAMPRDRPEPLEQRIDEIAARLDELFEAIDAIRSKLDDTAPAERWNNINRRIDEVFGVMQTFRSGSAAAPDAGAPEAPNDRGLFVVGHARSGTTVLADALNTSADVYCLMEPYFYRSFDIPNFAESFNAMHRGFGNPPIKGYWIPGFGGETARNVVSRLRSSYRYVGEKLAFRQREKDYDPDNFLEFAVETFGRSPFVCIVRDPVKVTSSVLDLFENSAFDPTVIGAVVRSQLETYWLILRLAMTVPSCYLLVHELIDGETFGTLGTHLGINLDRAIGLYVPGYQRTPHSPDGERILAADSRIQSLQAVYGRLRTLVDRRTLRLNDDQHGNSRSLCETIDELLRAT
jgi:hypothetical protein